MMGATAVALRPVTTRTKLSMGIETSGIKILKHFIKEFQQVLQQVFARNVPEDKRTIRAGAARSYTWSGPSAHSWSRAKLTWAQIVFIGY